MVARLALYFTLALVSSLVLTPLCRACALRLGYVATPSQDRWHQRATALLGGVGISATVLLLGVVFLPFSGMWQLLMFGGAVALLGLADDLLSLKPSTKLIVECVIASAAV